MGFVAVSNAAEDPVAVGPVAVGPVYVFNVKRDDMRGETVIPIPMPHLSEGYVYMTYSDIQSLLRKMPEGTRFVYRDKYDGLCLKYREKGDKEVVTKTSDLETYFYLSKKEMKDILLYGSKAGAGIAGMGISIAVGSLLYTIIQGVKTKERRRLMRIAIDRIFGRPRTLLSAREERIIRSLYRDLGIGAAGVVAGATGAGVGAWMYRKKNPAAEVVS
jgi:hypothetical protein